MSAETERWPLASGTWVSKKDSGYRLILTSEGAKVSDLLSDQDIAYLVGAHCQEGSNPQVFPPEFSYSPCSGYKLSLCQPIVNQGWVPPYGATLLDSSKHIGSAIRGLDGTRASLSLANADQLLSSDEAELSLPSPPPGSYEFVSTRAASNVPALFALEPNKGTIYSLLPATKRWIEVRHESGGGLARWSRPQSALECEVATKGNRSVIFTPTDQGLACIDLDVMSLTFSVKYFGKGEALAAPLFWLDQVWLPVSSPQQEINLVAVDTAGAKSVVFKVPHCPSGEVFAPPVCNENVLIWPGEHGQLIVQKKTDGSFGFTHLPWPEGLTPEFKFGCPYISREGSFWQICWNNHVNCYVYLQLGRQNPEQHETYSPRLCTGHVTYRFLKPMRDDPWFDPPAGDDAMNDRYLIPVVESTENRAVFGLEIQTISGLQSILETTERQRVLLVIGDEHNTVRFHTVTMSEPRKCRLFLYDDKLWFYHPTLEQILGWSSTS